jgi:hypothetical protein
MNIKSPGNYTYSGPIYVESINVEKEFVIYKSYEKINNETANKEFGLIIFIISSVLSIITLISGLIIIKVKSCTANMKLTLIVFTVISALISLISTMYNGIKLKTRKTVVAYYLKDETVSITDKVVPVYANMREKLPNVRTKILFSFSIIYICMLLILFYFIYKCK